MQTLLWKQYIIVPCLLCDTVFLIRSLPVDGYRGHGVDAGEHRGDGEEVVEPAVHLSKVPLSVRRVDEVDERVERRHRHVGEGQVEQAIVGDSPHPLVRQNDPDHDQVAENRHRQHGAVSHRPQRDAPRRLHELVGQIAGRVGRIPFRGHSSVGSASVRCWHAAWITPAPPMRDRRARVLTCDRSEGECGPDAGDPPAVTHR